MRARARRAAAALAVLAVVGSACDGGGRADTPAPTALTAAPTTTAPPATTAAGGRAPVTSLPPSTWAANPDLAAVRIRLTPVAGLEQPVALAVRPGDPTLYLAERPGRVRALRDGRLVAQPVLDLSDRTVARGERGLLGMAFAPDGAHLYVSYTDPDGDSHLDEYAVAADGSVDPASRRQVLVQEQPYANHNGGGIVFGPDGYLYVGFGDGGSAGDPERRALRLDTWLGKLLRIDPRPAGDQPYTVPADNPFVGQAGALPEIWSYGLRNPWRFSFDRATGDLWIGDVGQGQREEVDLAPASAGRGRGLNFGWSAFEGTRRYNTDQSPEGTVGPVHEYTHGGEPGGCSITGGYVYRGRAVPALQGAYVFADYCVPGLRAVPSGAVGAQATVLTEGPGAVISFGEDQAGELHVLTLDGQVLRLDPA